MIIFFFFEKIQIPERKSLHLKTKFDNILKPMLNRKAEIWEVADTHVSVVMMQKRQGQVILNEPVYKLNYMQRRSYKWLQIK